MTCSFRIRIVRCPFVTIETKAEEIHLPELDPGITLTLKAAGSDKRSLKEAEHWVLTGDGYPTEGKALKGAARLRNNLLLGLTHARLGADYGDMSGKSVLTAHGEKHFSKHFGRRILNDSHGAMAYISFRPLASY